MLVIFEGLILCFWLLLICVIGIANGPAGLVVFHEPDSNLFRHHSGNRAYWNIFEAL